MSERSKRIEACLKEYFQPEYLDIIDDSASHAGHAAAGGGGHFNVTIISAAFAGKTLIQRHRIVYKALHELMENDIHALSIRAYAPDEPFSK